MKNGEISGIVFPGVKEIGLKPERRQRIPKGQNHALATAHAAKFGDAVRAATGQAPELPSALAALANLPERFDILPAETGAIRAYIEAFAARKS